jgi:hypothetical protein
VVSSTLTTPSQKLPKTIDHTFLRQWKPDDNANGYGADLLVDESITELQLLDLVTHLVSNHDPVCIRIFTSREAYSAEKNETYGDIYARGYILFYVKNDIGKGAYRGFNEIRWMQEKGRFESKYGTKTKL